jgi:hypothetical protein
MFSPISPTDCYILDLGLDMVWHYKFDSATGGLTPSEETSMPADGVAMGPRHIAVHPSGEYGADRYRSLHDEDRSTENSKITKSTVSLCLHCSLTHDHIDCRRPRPPAATGVH